jgi:hypothetical protein
MKIDKWKMENKKAAKDVSEGRINRTRMRKRTRMTRALRIGAGLLRFNPRQSAAPASSAFSYSVFHLNE